MFTAFDDGRTSSGDVYEDRTGVAVGLTPDRFEVLTRDAPAIASPHATGAFRSMDAVPFEDRVVHFYECSRPDGAHELRAQDVPLG